MTMKSLSHIPAFLFLSLNLFLGWLLFSQHQELETLTHETSQLEISLENIQRQNKISQQHQALLETIKQEGYLKEMPFKEVKERIQTLLTRYHIQDAHLKLASHHTHERELIKKYTLFITADLDQDAYGLIHDLPSQLSGLVRFSLFSLFLEEDGSLKGEIGFDLISYAPRGKEAS